MKTIKTDDNVNTYEITENEDYKQCRTCFKITNKTICPNCKGTEFQEVKADEWTNIRINRTSK